jgi:hypothetical protein
MARTLTFVTVLILHWVGQFVAWSYAERSAPARVVWTVLATPLVSAGGILANRHFWIVSSLNSILWAAVLTYVIARFGQQH